MNKNVVKIAISHVLEMSVLNYNELIQLPFDFSVECDDSPDMVVLLNMICSSWHRLC